MLVGAIDGLEHRVTIRDFELQRMQPVAVLGGKGVQSLQISHSSHDLVAACQRDLRPVAASAARRARDKPNFLSGHGRLLMLRKA